jgi:arsenate reductase
MLQVLHNPRCGKSRNCLLFLEDADTKYEIINYLENPLSVEQLKILIQKLDIKPLALVRQKEPIWVEKFQDKKMTNAAILKAIAKYPILMQRPIIIDGDKAIIGREPSVLDGFI